MMEAMNAPSEGSRCMKVAETLQSLLGEVDDMCRTMPEWLDSLDRASDTVKRCDVDAVRDCDVSHVSIDVHNREAIIDILRSNVIHFRLLRRLQENRDA